MKGLQDAPPPGVGRLQRPQALSYKFRETCHGACEIGLWATLRTANSNFSTASWAPSLLSFLFPASFAAAIAFAALYRDWLWVSYGVLGVMGVAIAALLFICLSHYLLAQAFRVWRSATAPVGQQNSQGAKTIMVTGAQLVRSAEKMTLVVTPARGGMKVGMFVDLSDWRTSVSSAGWSKPERLYLGKIDFLSANVKFSVIAIEREPTTRLGWVWNTLKHDGLIAGTRPWLMHGRLRATFIFADPNGLEQKFPMLIVQPKSENDQPVIVTLDDFAVSISPRGG